MAKVVLYSTSCASTLKMKTDISRVKQLLHIKKVEYEEVRDCLWRQVSKQHQLCNFCPVQQVDLAAEPQRRSEMVAASEGVSSLPQLHLNDKYIGDFYTVQEMANFGSHEPALNVPHKRNPS